MNKSTAEKDATTAAARGDYKLFAVNGYTVEVPGTDLNASEAGRRFGYVVIEGTSDEIMKGRCGELNIAARQYAEIYNKTIISLRR